MAKKFRYTERFGRELAALGLEKAKNPPKRYRIIPSISGSKWLLLYEGRRRAIRIFRTQKEAIAYAKNSENKSILEVVVHDESGMKFKTLSLKSLNHNAVS